MLKKVLIPLLIFLLSAPLNAGAAAWMAMSMSDSAGHAALEDPASGHGSHHATQAMQHSGVHDTVNGHEHDAQDCEEHCFSCNNHCSNTAIPLTVAGYIDASQSLTGLHSGAVLNRNDLLFRPPINS